MGLLAWLSSLFSSLPFPIDDLPQDLFGEVLLYLDPVCLGKLRQTSSTFQTRIDNHNIWAIRYRQVFPDKPLPDTLQACRTCLDKHWVYTDLADRAFSVEYF